MQTFTEFTGAEYLLIDAANHFGLDKEIYSVRLEWARANLDNLENCIDKADEPNMFAKAVRAIRTAQEGKPTGHLVEFDAIASGIQLLSVTARCETGMMNSGVINTGVRPDPYTKCTDVMNRKEYLRKAVKNALMTYFYGSERQPILTFGEGEDLELFFQAAKVVAPEAYHIRNIFINAWQPMALAHSWELPDNAEVYKRVWTKNDYKIHEPILGSSFTFRVSVNEGKEKGVSLVADVTHSLDAYLLRELCRRCNYDRKEVGLKIMNIRDELLYRGLKTDTTANYTNLRSVLNALEADVIEMTDNELQVALNQLEEMCRYQPFDVVCIHDAFKAHPNNMNYLRRIYNRILWEMYQSDILPKIYNQITGHKLNINPVCPKIAAQILEADYAIS